MQFLGQDTWEKPKHHTGRLWHFSDVEKQHLWLAMGAFTLALGFMRVGGIGGLNFYGFSTWLIMLLLSMPVMFIAIGPAFLFHEIGHKLVAKKNGCWAEFRADPKGLQFGIALSLILGILFMAPGAVMVAGLVTRRQNGHIAVAGPLTNLSLFLIGIPLWGIVLGLTGAFDSLPPTDSILGRTYLLDGGWFGRPCSWTWVCFGRCEPRPWFVQHDSLGPARRPQGQGLERASLLRCLPHFRHPRAHHVHGRLVAHRAANVRC